MTTITKFTMSMFIHTHDALFSLSQGCFLSPSGGVFSIDRLQYRISPSAFVWLVNAKYIEVDGNGMYMITDAGKAALEAQS